MIGPEETVSEHMRERRRSGLIWIAVALILGITLGATYRIDRRADDSDRKLSASSGQVETLKGQVQSNGSLAQSAKDAADEANRRLRAAGKPTVPVPTVTPVSPTAAAPVQQDQFTEEEAAAVRVIVADLIARQKVQITQAEISQIARVAAALIPKPKDGKPPTQAELQRIVTVTVAAYCVGDKCVGKQGSEGKQGPGGPPGDDAPKVTDEELLKSAQLALASYCGQESQPCKGDDGTDGVDGKDGIQGERGRGITSTKCQEDGSWLFSYSDGSSETVDGPCRVLVPPNPARTGN